MHAKGIRQTDGSLLIPADLVAQWDRQIATPYAELSENEKESDRDQVRKYLPAIIEALCPK
jgi:tRNA A37 threonylcarbamoyladenosine synthetase subunit TsaC/SUA5/YrdC